MKRRLTVFGTVVLINLVFCVQAAFALPLEWTLFRAQFDDGTFAGGSYVYDARTNTVSQWRIVTNNGPNLNGFTYTSSNSRVALTRNDIIQIVTPDDSRQLLIELVAPMTDSGGTIRINASASGERGPRTGADPPPTVFYKRFFEINGPEVSTRKPPRLKLPNCFISSLTGQ